MLRVLQLSDCMVFLFFLIVFKRHSILFSGKASNLNKKCPFPHIPKLVEILRNTW